MDGTIYEQTRVRASTVTAALTAPLVPVDPGALAIQVTSPTAVVTTKSWPADAQVVRDGPGLFHYDIDANTPGVWHWRWRATGVVQATDAGRFKVEPAP